MITLGYTKYKIRITYKSGYVHDFWTYTFKAERDGSKLTQAVWNTVNSANKPLLLGVDNVESVWQIGYKRGFLGEKK